MHHDIPQPMIITFNLKIFTFCFVKGLQPFECCTEPKIHLFLSLFFDFLFLSFSFLLSPLKIICGPSMTKSATAEAQSVVCMLTPYPTMHAPQVKVPFCLLDRSSPCIWHRHQAYRLGAMTRCTNKYQRRYLSNSYKDFGNTDTAHACAGVK